MISRISRAVRRAVERRRRASGAPIYLISAAGQPNFGDEFITRAWLDWLAENHPRSEVWLDCLEPGRAAHLFQDTHPRLRTTNTLWQIAHTDAPHGQRAVEERMERLVSGLGSPKVDFGLRELRRMRSIHLLGGGYMNTIWRNNLAILSAMVAVKRHFGVPIYATGQGLLPHQEESREWMRTQLAELDYVEARDRSSAQAFDVPHGTDDAFLAFATNRKIYADKEHLPHKMVLMQGDLVDADRVVAMESITRHFVSSVDEGQTIGFAEGVPPDDVRFSSEFLDHGAEFFPFMRIWDDGFPAFPGQEWLTSRFHFHLLAAAAGARGTLVNVSPGYYDIKHELLLELGTGWSMQDDASSGEALPPSGSPGFPQIARRLGAEKAALAEHLYRASLT